jgi:transglycosylase-like protein with SLT domain
VVAGIAGLVVLFFALNWVYQVARKPAELFFPVSGVLAKTPAETWREYHPIFRRHSTPIVTPELLAALAQVESAGNPVARTYWRWQMTVAPMNVYRPASSAVGMYQITDGTFADARRYCIRDHAVVDSCWFNALYMRVVPSHAAELTAVFLHRAVSATLERHRVASATPQQKQDLAAVIHLCGATVGDAYARRHFRLTDRQRCGDHEVAVYLARVNAMKRAFTRLANEGR